MAQEKLTIQGFGFNHQVLRKLPLGIMYEAASASEASGLCVSGCVVRGLQSYHQTRIRERLGRREGGGKRNPKRRLKRRSKTKNFLSISFSASRRRGGGRRRRKNARTFFGFCTRESASVSEAYWFASRRNRSVRRSFRSPRAPRVRFSPRQDFAQNTFELCPINTARTQGRLRHP